MDIKTTYINDMLGHINDLTIDYLPKDLNYQLHGITDNLTIIIPKNIMQLSILFNILDNPDVELKKIINIDYLIYKIKNNKEPVIIKNCKYMVFIQSDDIINNLQKNIKKINEHSYKQSFNYYCRHLCDRNITDDERQNEYEKLLITLIKNIPKFKMLNVDFYEIKQGRYQLKKAIIPGITIRAHFLRAVNIFDTKIFKICSKKIYERILGNYQRNKYFYMFLYFSDSYSYNSQISFVTMVDDPYNIFEDDDINIKKVCKKKKNNDQIIISNDILTSMQNKLTNKEKIINDKLLMLERSIDDMARKEAKVNKMNNILEQKTKNIENLEKDLMTRMNNILEQKIKCVESLEKDLVTRMKQIQDQDRKVEEMVQDMANDEGSLCMICMDAKREVAFVNCGHYACCNTCSTNVVKSGSKCPVCRETISRIIQIFKP